MAELTPDVVVSKVKRGEKELELKVTPLKGF